MSEQPHIHFIEVLCGLPSRFWTLPQWLPRYLPTDYPPPLPVWQHDDFDVKLLSAFTAKTVQTRFPFVQCNARQEFFGDRLFSFALTMIMRKPRYDSVAVWHLHFLQAQLKSGPYLSLFGCLLGFQHCLIRGQEHISRAGHIETVTQADVEDAFEAYLDVVCEVKGLDALISWVGDLIDPFINVLLENLPFHAVKPIPDPKIKCHQTRCLDFDAKFADESMHPPVVVSGANAPRYPVGTLECLAVNLRHDEIPSYPIHCTYGKSGSTGSKETLGVAGLEARLFPQVCNGCINGRCGQGASSADSDCKRGSTFLPPSPVSSVSELPGTPPGLVRSFPVHALRLPALSSQQSVSDLPCSSHDSADCCKPPGQSAGSLKRGRPHQDDGASMPRQAVRRRIGKCGCHKMDKRAFVK